MPRMNDACTCAAPAAPFLQTRAYIARQEAASARYLWLHLRCPEIARAAKPGQFVMLACAPDGPNGGGELILPRPLAILDAVGDDVQLLYFVAGAGTEMLRRSALAQLAQDGASAPAPLRIIGPLGRGFEPIPDVDVHLAVGGGSGVAPLVFFFRRAAKDAARWHLILAARSSNQLAREEVVRVPGRLHRATDDGSAGLRGTGIDAMNALLAGELRGQRVGIYAAGPDPMMHAAAQVAKELNLPCHVSLESRMACGVGVCRACVVDGTGPHPKTGLRRRTVCQDGPVFDISELAGW